MATISPERVLDSVVMTNRSTRIRVNGELRGTPHVRVLDAHGEDLGEMNLAHALRAAMARGLDLVETNPLAEPPVCRLLDFGGHRGRR
jgi:translation initiation factor IF-3